MCSTEPTVQVSSYNSEFTTVLHFFGGSSPVRYSVSNPCREKSDLKVKPIVLHRDVSPPVLSSVDSLCVELLSGGKLGFDPSPAVTRAVTNVVCTLVFSATYRPGDPELQEVIKYNDGIVETIARGGLVDIFPWLKVS